MQNEAYAGATKGMVVDSAFDLGACFATEAGGKTGENVVAERADDVLGLIKAADIIAAISAITVTDWMRF